MVFALGTLDGITLTSLVVALIALAVTLSVYYVTRRQMSDFKSLDKSIDAYAVVQEFSQRSKKLEERLIDQKVRLEILELRQQRGVPSKVEVREVKPYVNPQPEVIETLPQISEEVFDSHLVRSEIEALRVVLEAGPSGASAKHIQARIGRSREHTARMMNSLFKQGLVERNAQARPFTYTITQKGRMLSKE